MGHADRPPSRLGSRVSEGGAAPDRSSQLPPLGATAVRSEEGGSRLDGPPPRLGLWPHLDLPPTRKRVFPQKNSCPCYKSSMSRKVDGLKLECTRCHVMKARGQFAVRESRTGRGVQRDSWCRECRAPVNAAAAHRRRERAIGRGTFIAGDIRRLWEVQYGLCHWCQKSLAFSGYHVDHVVPLVRGGANGRQNLVLACPTCNLTRKGGR